MNNLGDRLSIMNLLELLVVGFPEHVAPAGVAHHGLTDCHAPHALVVRALYPQLSTHVDVVPHGARTRARGVHVYFIRFIHTCKIQNNLTIIPKFSNHSFFLFLYEVNFLSFLLLCTYECIVVFQRKWRLENSF